jgi:hypothetical protein
MTEVTQDWPWHEPTVLAIIKRLEDSPRRVHQGAARIVAEEFSEAGDLYQASKMAADKGWPVEAVLSGFKLARGKP